MCKFRWTRPTSTLGVWSVKSATNSRLRATSPTKTSPSVKRTTRFVLSTRGWWSQSNCCKTWVEGMGGKFFWGKWEKLEAACFCYCWPAQLLSCLNWAWQRRWWGELIFAGPVNLCKWESLELHRNGLSWSNACSRCHTGLVSATQNQHRNQIYFLFQKNVIPHNQSFLYEPIVGVGD